ncbi:hypothetical protein [Saccharopolyspora taberi]
MAPDEELLDFTSRPGAAQRLKMFVTASQIALHYFDTVDHGLAEPPANWPEAGDAEAADDTSRVPGEAPGDQVVAAPETARKIVRLLARTPRNWTPLIVSDLDGFGRDMLDKAFFPDGLLAGKASNVAAPEPSEWLRGAPQVIAMVCPPRRWNDALDALTRRHELAPAELNQAEVARSRARIEAFALQHPVAAIHAAAAQVAWLSLQSSVVRDRAAAREEIASKMTTMQRKIAAHPSYC